MAVMRNLNLVLLIICFIAFAITQGISSNIPPKGTENRINYQIWASVSGIIAYGGLLILISRSSAESLPEGKVAELVKEYLKTSA